ncbi:MAG: DUF4878 domain-containing protein [Gordonia sp. (in: high G+C Gram-positive bacteria)]
MTTQKKLFRPTVAVAGLAAAAALVLGGCSSSDTDTATSKAKEATSAAAGKVEDATSVVTSAVDAGKAAVEGLANAKAQEILRKAVDPATPADQIATVVDTSKPGTEQAVIGYAKGSSAGGYTPDVYTVTHVESTDDVDGHKAAKVTVSVKSPHAPQPVDIQLTYVKIDEDWKLSGDAVTQLASMGGSHH